MHFRYKSILHLPPYHWARLQASRLTCQIGQPITDAFPLQDVGPLDASFQKRSSLETAARHAALVTAKKKLQAGAHRFRHATSEEACNLAWNSQVKRTNRIQSVTSRAVSDNQPRISSYVACRHTSAFCVKAETGAARLLRNGFT